MPVELVVAVADALLGTALGHGLSALAGRSSRPCSSCPR